MLAFAAMLFAACTDDTDSFPADGTESVVTFYPQLGNKTRAIGDAAQVNSINAAVYENGKLVYETTPVALSTAKADGIDLTLIVGHSYKIIFWAQNDALAPYSFDPNSPKVTVDYSNFTSGGFGNMEKLDAFYATASFAFDGKTAGGTINLARPLAMLNFADPDVQPKADEHTAVLTLSNVATSFNPFAGENEDKGSDFEEIAFTFSDFPTEPLVTGEGSSTKSYYYVTCNYLFPTTTVFNATLSLQDKNDNELKATAVTVPGLTPNTRTNVLGNVVQEPEWIPTDAIASELNDTIYPVHNAGELIWLAFNTPDDKVKTLSFEADIDLENKLLPNGLNLGNIKTIKGNGKTITRYKSKVGGLFGNATGITVENLTIDGATVKATPESATHVGALVNTLKGSSSFTNVTVKNADVSTTNGAAGGIVGYVVRNIETERREQLAVAFTDCTVEGGSISCDGATGTGYFVGLFSGYDNGETLTFTNCQHNVDGTNPVALTSDFESLYYEGNEAVWLSGNDYSAYNGFLGNEKHYRGKVMFEGTRFIPRWDGTTTVEPLLANATYDSGTTACSNGYVVYSPFDLAGVRKKTASPAAIYLRADVDMNGQGADGKYNVPSNFAQSVCASDDDKNFEPFNYVTTLDGKKSETENYSIYNLAITQLEQERAAFILYATGTTNHKNINFRNCQTVAVHKVVTTDAKAYGAILVSNVDATYTMENVHAYDCKVFALQKVGTLGARINGTSTLTNNSVNNCYVENYECFISERFTSGRINKSISLGFITAKVYEVYCDFYPHGEVGGMYGFIQGNSTLTNCKVNSTIVHGYGQDGKMATIDGNGWAQAGISMLGMYKVPGRHVSTMIGNIRATGTIKLTGCTVDSNSECTNHWDKHSNTCPYVGHAYFVNFSDNEGSLTVDEKSVTLGDCTTSIL